MRGVSEAGAGAGAGAGALGIVAGAGALPAVVARAAQARGREVFVLALRGAAEGEALAEFPHAWVGMGEVRRGASLLRERGAREVCLVGGVRRPGLAGFRGDWEGWWFLARWAWSRKGGGGDGDLLRAVERHLEARHGFRIVPAQEICESLTCPPGFLGVCGADAAALSDAELGVRVLAALGEFDVGQAVVVCRGVVLAVEAQEHTDRMLERVASLDASLRGTPEKRAGVLVKLPKPGQSRALDWPTIGERTAREASKAGLAGICLRAGGCLLVDAPAIARRADAENMFVLSLAEGEFGG